MIDSSETACASLPPKIGCAEDDEWIWQQVGSRASVAFADNEGFVCVTLKTTYPHTASTSDTTTAAAAAQINPLHLTWVLSYDGWQVRQLVCDLLSWDV